MARTKKSDFGVRQLPSRKYQGRYDAPDGSRRSAGTFDTATAALKAAKAKSVEVDAGIWRARKTGQSFRAYAGREVRIRDVGESTRRNYRSLLAGPLAFFADRTLDAITVSDVKVWWNIQSDRPVNRRNAYFLLRSVMASAVADDLIMKSPCLVKDAGKDVAAPRPGWATTEFRLVLEYVPTTLHTALEVLFASHARRGVLVGLNAEDYDRATGIVTISKQADGAPTKTRQVRSIRLLASGITALDRYLGDAPPRGDLPLFVGEKGGRLPMTTIRRAWNAAVAAAGFENFHLHEIRHIGLTAVAQSGASLKDVQTRGGHASIQAAMRYQHTDAERDVEVARKVDERLASGL